MKQLLLLTVLFLPGYSFAQSVDFILLQKNHHTIASYYKGNSISFTSTTGAYITADITAIKNDTLFLQQFIVQMIPTTLGVFVPDTVGSYRYAYHYNQVKSIDRSGRRFNFSASGASLLGGGVLLTLASGVVYLADRKKFSPELMVAGVALGTAGYFMNKASGKGMLIGKKYKLVYLSATDNRN